MKFKMTRETVYSLIYLSLAIATFKHTSWSFSTVMEGTEPIVNWAAFNGTFADLWGLGGLLIWYLWGALCAIAVDVGFYMTAKSIRESSNVSLIGMYSTYAMVAVISAYCQVMYSLQHAAQFAAVDGVPTWVNVVYAWRFLIMPVSLPGMSLGYTLFNRIDAKANALPIGTVDAETGVKYLTVDEAAAFTRYSPAMVRIWANKGLIGSKDGKNHWQFTIEELEKYKKTNV